MMRLFILCLGLCSACVSSKEEQAQKIAYIFAEYLIYPHSQTDLAQRLKERLANNEKLQMVLPAFPFKSANLEKKVLGSAPDLAERKSLEYLNGFAAKIAKVYPPGALITIVCDGLAIQEILGVEDATRSSYEQLLKNFASDLPALNIVTTEDLVRQMNFPTTQALRTHIDSFVDGPNDERELEALQRRLAEEFDHVRGRVMLAQKPIKTRAKALQTQQNRLRGFMEESFPNSQYLRLSVSSQDSSRKLGIKLFPNSTALPYHGVYRQEGLSGSIHVKSKLAQTKG